MTTAALGALVVLLAMSFATAVVPLGPPEALVVAMTLAATISPGWALAVAAAAASGQAAGKLLVFLIVRGTILRRSRLVNRFLRHRLLTKIAARNRQHPRHLTALVGVSAFTSVPPLVVISPLAGSTTMRPRLLLLTLYTGRLARFSVLAFATTGLW